MYFPGSDYMLYVQNAKFGIIGDAMREFGLSRFLMSCTSNVDGATPAGIEKLLESLIKDPWHRDRYELAVEKDDTMKYFTPHGNSDFPIWSLREDSSLRLKELAEEGHGMVFIKNTVLNIEMASRTTPEPMRRRIREMWEVVQHYGGAGTGQCKFIIYGYFQLQPHMCMGMSGGAVGPHRRGTYNNRVASTNGRYQDYDPANAAYYAKTLNMSHATAGNKAAVTLRAYQLMPEYMKKYYRNLDRVEYGITYIGKSMKQVDKIIGRQYWKSTINDRYVLKRPHANIWGTYGDENLCDHCSVAFSCRYYKKGAVCALPDSEGRSLASLFGSRNSDDVISGISKVLQYQAQRFESAAEAEFKKIEEAREAGEPEPPLDSDLMKLGTEIQRNAKQYATLINPNILKPQVSVNINNGNMTLSQAEITPQIMAKAARELEAAGHSREDITPSMLYSHISGGQIVESEVIDGMKRDF